MIEYKNSVIQRNNINNNLLNCNVQCVNIKILQHLVSQEPTAPLNGQAVIDTHNR